ncbi:MAG: putative gluconeogenesis factor [Candidatus Parcubacteria bacterium]|nr:MAG: putative gluconeogenesis factor [Candidatus Parcubacteria bacterium]
MKVVAIGGGTGLSTILTGLKKEYGISIKRLTAVVTVADSGGSSGILKKIYDIPAIGDLRNCLLALSNIESYFKKTIQHRFSKGEGLRGHPLGNLFLLALLETEGDILKAIKKASKILNLTGEIIPSTFDKVDLIAKFDDDTEIVGEENIFKYGLLSKHRIVDLKIVSEKGKINVPNELIKRILSADLIIFGPGSLFTSILPNVVIKDIRQSIIDSKAIKIFIVNLLTQPGETDNFTASDHVREFLKFSQLERIDAVIINKGEIIDRNLRKIMIQENKQFVYPDIEKIKNLGIKVYSGFLIKKDSYLKHSPYKLTKLILKIAKDYGIIKK